MFDLIIKNGLVVLADEVKNADIGVRDGRIAAIAPSLCECEAREVLDACGQYVMPGMVDAHMHVSEPGRTEWEGYETGTNAMAAGGITSFVEMPLNNIPATTDVESLEIKMKAAAGKCRVDYAPMGGLVPWNLADIGPLADAGVASFKAFVATCGSGKPGDFKNVNDYELFKGCQEIAKKDSLLVVHCENAALTDGLGAEAKAAGLKKVSDYVATRPIFTEVEAVHRVLMIAEAAGCRIHIAHCSCAEVIEEVRRRRAGLMRALNRARTICCLLPRISMQSARRQSARRPFAIVAIRLKCGIFLPPAALKCSFPTIRPARRISRPRTMPSTHGAASAPVRTALTPCSMRRF